MKSKPNAAAWLLLIVLSLIWGSSFILIKRGLVGLSAPEVGALRIVSASLFMLPVAMIQLKNINPGKWKYLFASGLFGSLLPSFLFATAQTRLPSGITGVLNALTPIFTILIAYFIYHQRHHKGVWIGVFTGFAGSTLLIISRSASGLTINYFAFLIVLATLFYAINVNIVKHHLFGQKTLAIASVSLALVGPIAIGYLFLFTPFISHIQESREALNSAGYIMFLGLMSTAVASILFNKLVQLTDPVFTSSVTYLIPIVAVIWGLLDKESLGTGQIVGMGIIIFGVYMANRPNSKNNL